VGLAAPALFVGLIRQVTISPTGSTSASKPGSTNQGSGRCLDARSGRIEIRSVKGRWHSADRI
jgi:hypothetical protein